MKSDTAQTYRQRILRVLVHIQEHLGEALTLDHLARVSGFSSFHFHRIFRALVGESVHQYVRRLRLEGAAVKLKLTEQPIVEVALGAGYETHEAFTRAFTALFGMTPSMFRAEHAATPSTAAPTLGLRGALGGAAGQDPDVFIKRIRPQRIAFIRHVGPYAEVGAAFERLMSWAAPRGLLRTGAAIVGVPYDDPAVTFGDKIRFDAALVVDGEIEPDGEIGVREIPGGEHAIVCHHGPYRELARTYELIYGRWLPTSGREPADTPPFERYLNDPESTEPEELLTDVHVPLKE